MRESKYEGQRLIAQAGLAILLTISAFGSLGGYRPAFADANPGGAASTQIGGTVFQDFNNNGVMNIVGDAANPAIDKGVAGVIVSAYISGSLAAVATTTSGTGGVYTLIGLTAGTLYRIEFTNLPTDFLPSFHGNSGSATVPSSGTNVQFAAAGTSNVSYGINKPCDYCQANPDIVSTRQQEVDGSNATQPALIQFPYTAGSNVESGSASPTYGTLLTENAVGTVFSLAYSRSPKRLYAAAHMKRYTRFGTGGPGAIYVVDPATNAVVNTFTVPGATTNLHDTANYASDYIVAGGSVTNTWDAVGKTAIGGLATNENGSVLYAMNLENRTLYAINTNTGAVIASQAVPQTGCPGGNVLDARPYAVEFYNNALYVGVTCTAESSQVASDLRLLIYTVNSATLAFGASPVFSTSVNYKRDQASNEFLISDWRAWNPLFKNASTSNIWVSYPQPWFTDIAFDGANLIFGLRDRYSDQVGDVVLEPGGFNYIRGISAGDTLRACASGATWVLEGSAGCVNSTGGGTNAATISEFYNGENYSYPPDPVHTETSLGTVLQVPGYAEAAVSVFDPVFATAANAFTYTYRDGVRWMNNTTGVASRGYETVGNDFGKNGGLGDVIALCDPMPIEIGNRIWNDVNNNGIQDPGEPALSGVSVTLMDASGNTATTTTAPDGTYYFTRTTSGATPGPVQPNTAYTLTVPTNNSGLILTTQDASSNANDTRDSDANTGTGQVSFVTGGTGSSNHNYDFGYTASQPAIALRKFVNGYDADIAPGVYIAPGSPVTWTYIMTNTGDVTLNSIALTDDKIGTIVCPKNTLVPGESQTCTANGTAIASLYVNAGTVTGVDSTNPTRVLTATNPANYFGPNPNYVLKKFTNGYDADNVNDPQPVLKIGDPVTWTYIVTNTGNVAVDFAAGALVDDKEGAINPAAFTLQAGQSATFNKPGVATVVGQYANTSVITGTYTPPANGVPDLPSFPVQPSPVQTIVRDDPSHYRADALPRASLGDYVWLDLDRDGQQETGEPPVPSVLVTLYDVNGGVVATTTTDVNGLYRFDNLTPGVPYSVGFAAPNGYVWTTPTTGNPATDSNADANGRTAPVTLAPGEHNPTIDAGLWIAPAFRISKAVSTSSGGRAASPGDELTYTILVTNTGVVQGSAAVTVTDLLNPLSVQYVPGSAGPAQYFTGQLTPMAWVIPNMAAGQTVSLFFRVKVLPTALEAGTAITNVALLQNSVIETIVSNEVAVPFAPTSINLSVFTATAGINGGTTVAWRTTLEQNSFGFYVLRSLTGKLDDAVKVNTELVVAKGASAYELNDVAGAAKNTYWLQEIELNGAVRTYGPIMAVTAGVIASVEGVSAQPAAQQVVVYAAVANPGGVAVPAVVAQATTGSTSVSPPAPVAQNAQGAGSTVAAVVIEATPAVVAQVSTEAAQTAEQTKTVVPPGDAVEVVAGSPGPQVELSVAAQASAAQVVEQVVVGADNGVAVARGGNVATSRLPQTNATAPSQSAPMLMGAGVLMLVGAALAILRKRKFGTDGK